MKKNQVIWGSIIILALIVTILAISIPEEKSFEITDRCGPIVNLISHTVADKNSCEVQCRAQCESKEMKFSKVEFEGRERACNSCTCFCTEKLFSP